MKHILFVDDDARVLEGLRLRLRGRRHEWNMAFASSGAQALAELERQAFDVIVSDVQMDDMSGTRLLASVNERWPDTIRIALSGIADSSQALRLAPLAHQFLSKPCAPHVLENALERCLTLRDLLNQPQLRSIVGRMRGIAPLRGTYAKLQSALSNENVTVHEVAAIVACDTIIAAKVLQLANSSFFRTSRTLSNVDHAVGYLGVGIVRNLVLSVEIFSRWPESLDRSIVDLELLQSHTHAVAAVARTLTRGTSIADDTALAALVHDIGYWVLAHEYPSELERAHAEALDEQIPMHEAEMRILGASHAEIGAYLLGIWGLPYPIVEAVAHHHMPQRVRHSHLDALAALAIAHSLAGTGDECAFAGPPVPDARVDASYLAAVHAPFTWDDAAERAREALDRFKEAL